MIYTTTRLHTTIRLPLKTDLHIRIEDAVRPLVSRLSGDANGTFFFFFFTTLVLVGGLPQRKPPRQTACELGF